MNPLARLSSNPRVYRQTLRAYPVVERVDRILRAVTGGRIGVPEIAGLPAARITVAGRRSGEPRTVTLYTVPDGDSLLVIGSNWALPHHPTWTVNFMAATTVQVDDGHKQYDADVEVLTGPGQQRAWDWILNQWPNYQIAQDLARPRTFRIFKLTQRNQ